MGNEVTKYGKTPVEAFNQMRKIVNDHGFTVRYDPRIQRYYVNHYGTKKYFYIYECEPQTDKFLEEGHSELKRYKCFIK